MPRCWREGGRAHTLLLPMRPQGVHAAVLVPRSSDGAIDERGFRRILEFLESRGLSRIVVNGATGEYCLTTPPELARLLAICNENLSGSFELLCGIGAASVPGCLERGRIALDSGARTLLLPMPYFFPYSQDDLESFCRAVAGNLNAPVLLYNLPAFTTPLELATVQSLIAAVPNIIGVKDSSGSLSILRGLAGSGASRIVGDDSVLVAALREQAADGVVSGVAGVLPELITFVYEQRDSPDYARGTALLAEVIQRLSIFPVPWGLKLIAECRGLAEAVFLQTASSVRANQACEFRAWFSQWWPAAEPMVKA